MGKKIRWFSRRGLSTIFVYPTRVAQNNHATYKPVDRRKNKGLSLHTSLLARQERILVYYTYTEIYTLKSRKVNFRWQTDVNQSNVA